MVEEGAPVGATPALDLHDRPTSRQDNTPPRVLDARWHREAQARMYWGMINGGLCPYCGERFTDTEKRGCCTHAVPCGHKLWQGRRP